MPFGAEPSFDFERFKAVVGVSIRALDNVLDATLWPLPAQADEARNKRRVGLGFTGMGNTLTMLNLRYDSDEGRGLAADITRAMRDGALCGLRRHRRRKGRFPLFDADKMLAAPHCASRLPEDIKARARKHGLRNSHLLSIAPTGTISLAFASNASGGIEPTFSWTYVRKKRMPDGSKQEYTVEDYAYRLFRHMGGDVDKLPPTFVHALDMSAMDHMKMIAAVQPYIDAAVSKTVNVPEDYPFTQFRDLYLEAWKAGLKGITTYRPNNVIGSVLEVRKDSAPTVTPQDLKDDTDRRVRLSSTPQPALASLKWPGRPDLANGNMAWTYMVEIPERKESFAIFIGETGAPALPFEVWVNGAEQPRGLGAIAKSLSMDMRSEDRAWLKMKLDALAKARDEQGFMLAMPPEGAQEWCNGVVAAFARIVQLRCDQLGTFSELAKHATPVLDALFSKKEPKAGPLGTMSWTVDIENPEHRRRLRARRQGAAAARRQPPPLLDLARRRVSARARRPVQADLARHARGRCQLDRPQAQEAAATSASRTANSGRRCRARSARRCIRVRSPTSPCCCCTATRCSACSTTTVARSAAPASWRCPTLRRRRSNAKRRRSRARSARVATPRR